MRGLVQTLLESVEPGITVLQGSAIDEAQPEFPFIIHKFSIGAPTPSGLVKPGLEVWCYDQSGSYLRIDRILDQVKTTLLAYPFTSLNGREHIAVVDWTNDSADLPAEEFHGITRMSAFNLVGRSS